MDYRIKSRRQIQLLTTDLTGYLIGNIILGIIVWIINERNIVETIVVMMIAMIPILLPLIIIHLNYYFTNRNLVVTIDRKKNLITICKSEFKRTFTFEDIEEIYVAKGICYKNEKVNKNVPKFFSDPIRLPWSEYGYIKLYFKSKEVMVMTALMVDLKEIPFENYKTNYHLIPMIID